MLESTLIMTSSIRIDPSQFHWAGCSNRTDLHTRLHDYTCSLIAWLRYGPYEQIVFCDNTDHGLNLYPWSDLAMLAGRKLEILNWPNDYYGKGEGEARTLAWAKDNSYLLRESRLIAKTTGRYYTVVPAGIPDNSFWPCKHAPTVLIETSYWQMKAELFETKFKTVAVEKVHQTNPIERVYRDIVDSLPKSTYTLHSQPLVQMGNWASGKTIGEWPPTISMEADRVVNEIA